ncbi:MAG: hypothetical protein NXI10_15225 [bacterium]|nr:hypothetical protein [bacterium]
MSAETNDNHPTEINQSENNSYFFEKQWLYGLSWFLVLTKIKVWKIDDDRSLLLKRIKLNQSHVSGDKELSNAIDAYLKQCLKNIFYYRRKIIKENILRKAYGFFTLLIVTCVPLFIFLYTDKAVGGYLPEGYNFLQVSEEKKEDVEGKNEQNASNTKKEQTKSSATSQGTNVDRVVYFDPNAPSSLIHTAAQIDSSRMDGSTTRGRNIGEENLTEKTPAQNTKSLDSKTEEKAEMNGGNKPSDGADEKPENTGKDEEKPNDKNEEDKQESDKEENLGGLEAVGIMISLLLTSLFAVHQVISQWTGKRKFRAHFHQAQTDLMNIHFELEAIAESTFAFDPEYYDIPGLKEALQKATLSCRTIVREETKKYFEMSASPAVELGGIFSSSMTTANSLVSAFTSKRYTSEVERMRSAVQEQRATKKTLDGELQKLIIEEKSVVLKLKKLLDRQERLEDELAELDALSSSNDIDRRKKLADTLELLEDKIDQAEIELEDAHSKVDLKRFEISQNERNG